jgi:hypothetical protein
LAVNAESFVPNRELTQLLDIFPLGIRQALVRLPYLDRVIEVVLDLGRPPEARFEDAATTARGSSTRCTASARSAIAPGASSGSPAGSAARSTARSTSCST